MNVNRGTIAALFRAELRMLLRDRRSLILSVVLPVVLMPLLLLATSRVKRAQERELEAAVHRYAVTGSQATVFREAVAATRARRTPDGSGAPAPAPFRFEEVTNVDPAAALRRGDIQLHVDALTVAEARAAPGDADAIATPAAAPDPGEAPGDAADDEAEEEPENWREPLVPGAPVFRLVYRGDRDASRTAMQQMAAALRETRREQRSQLLAAQGLPIAAGDVAAVTEQDLSTRGQAAGLMLGRVVTVFLLLFILSGSAVVATDSLAGEKERGTLETLLTTAASRLDIVLAKHATILVVALGITLIQGANLLVYVGLRVIPVPEDLAAAVPPGVAVLLLVLFLPLAALAASTLLLASGYARSYKEAQFYFLPVFVLAIVPALAPLLPGLPLRSAIVLVPIANVAVAARDILVGRTDWLMIAVAWLVTAAAAVLVTRRSVGFLSNEKLITASESDAIDVARGQPLFARQVGRWFLVMWALLLIVSNYSGADPRVQALVNIPGLFFVSCVLMIRRYRLDPRAAFAWRRPHPWVWPAVLLGAPSGLLAGVGLMQLANLFLPVPPRLLEEFGRALLGQEMPAWQIVFFFALLPGVFEELTFRGVLLYGLHRRLRPPALVLVVGLVFGLFHVALFRIVPTAFLGVLFTATALLTGSVFPTMLWHALNNALSFALGSADVPLDRLHPLWYWAGAAGLAVTFWMLWRARTPYPGLRPWRAPDRAALASPPG